MTDLRPMWEAICRDLGINPRLVRAHFLEMIEVKFDFDCDYGYFDGWGAARWPDDGELPEVVVVFPYSERKSGLYLDIVELKDTCYHELIHLLLREEISEKEVAELADILYRQRNEWHYLRTFWRSYLRGRAIALGLGPPDTAGMTLWQYARVKRKRHRRERAAGGGLASQFVKGNTYLA